VFFVGWNILPSKEDVVSKGSIELPLSHLVVLLPAFNEGKNIGRVVRGVLSVAIPGVQISVLVVNDGSRDDTASEAERAGAIVISHPKNRGVGAAIRTGFDWALSHGADLLVHMDSDGQVLPEELPLVVAPVLAGRAELAVGCRFLGSAPKGLSRWKAVALSSLAQTVGVLTGYSLHDLSCGLRCMNQRILKVVRPTFEYDYIQETLIQALAHRAIIVEIPVHIRYEPATQRTGMSGRTFRYSWRFLALTGYSLLQFYRERLTQ
jgi:glycosyltransferase involved in cell wall biosynthesis